MLIVLVLAVVVIWGLVAVLSNPIGQFIAVLAALALFFGALKRMGVT